jgi:hypothetical protein
MEQKRIQRKRKKGWKMPLNTVYVGRGSFWGNPFRVGTPVTNGALAIVTFNLDAFSYRKFRDSGGYPVPDIKTCLSFYQKWLTWRLAAGMGKDKGLERIKELNGKNLCCWCPLDKPCHADILLKIANH